MKDMGEDVTPMGDKKDTKLQEKQKDPLDTLLTINLLFKGGKDKAEAGEEALANQKRDQA